MKKIVIAIIAVLLVCVLSFSLFACNNKPSNNTENNGNKQETNNGGKEQKPSGGEGGNNTVVRTGKTLDEYEACTNLMLIYAEQYLTNNATDSLDISNALKKDINKQAAAIKGDPITSITVALVDGSYKLSFTYKDKSTFEYHEADALVARKAEKGTYAGYAFDESGEPVDFLVSLGTVLNSLGHAVNKAMIEGEEFGTKYKTKSTGGNATGIEFGGSVSAAFELSYGTGENKIGPMSYGINVYGTLGYDAKDTEVAIEIVDELKDVVVFGLYYKQSTLYMSIDIEYKGYKRNADHKIVDASGNVIEDEKGKIVEGKEAVIETKKYKQQYKLSDADINAILASVLGEAFKQECEHNYVEGYCTKCGKLDPNPCIDADGSYVDEEGNYYVHTYGEDGICVNCGAKESIPFYEHDDFGDGKEALVYMANGNSMVGTIVQIVGALATSYSSPIKNGTRYQYKIELGRLINDILGNPLISATIGSSLNPVTKSIFPELDLGSFRGIGGDILLSFDVVNGKDADDNNTTLLSGVQISYNAAQKDFRWNGEDDEPKIYGPVNVAITVSNFDIGATEVNIENASSYKSFSPLNGEVSAEITYADANDASLDGDYKLIARAEFNPFTIFAGGENRVGEAEIILDKKDGNDYAPYAHVYMHNFTYTEADGYDCTVTVLYGGKYYETLASQSDFFKTTFDDFIWPLVARDSNSNLAAISEYVWELVDQFSQPYVYADFTKDVTAYEAEIDALVVTKTETKIVKDEATGEETEEIAVMPSSKWLDAIKSNAKADIAKAAAKVNAESNKKELKKARKEIAGIVAQAKSDYSAQLKLEGKYESFMDGFNVVSLLSNFSALKGVFIKGDNTAANADMFDFDLNLTNPKLWANLDSTAYNKVIDVLKKAIPKLEDLDADAAKVTVDMNYTTANKGKMKVDVTYKGYEVHVIVDINALFEELTDEKGNKYTAIVKEFHSGTFTANIQVIIPKEDYTETNNSVDTYTYVLTAVFDKWDENNGTIVVTFTERDSKATAGGEFVKVEVTQSWDGKEYRGFDAVLTLKSRKNDGSAMNAAHVYNVSGKYDKQSDMYSLSIAECGITLSIGKFEGDLDWTEANLLSYGIPVPSCGFDMGIKMGDKDVSISVKNLKIAAWGSDIAIRGITIPQEAEVIRNSADDKSADTALYNVVVDLFEGFFTVPAVE